MNNFVFHLHFCKSIRQSKTYLNIYLLSSYTKASAVEELSLFDSIGSLLLAPANFRQLQLLDDIIVQRHYIASRVNHELYSSTTNILDIFFRVKNVSCETKKFTEPVREVEIPTRNPDGNRGDFFAAPSFPSPPFLTFSAIFLLTRTTKMKIGESTFLIAHLPPLNCSCSSQAPSATTFPCLIRFWAVHIKATHGSA